MLFAEKEKERETGRQTNTHTHTHTQRERERERERERGERGHNSSFFQDIRRVIPKVDRDKHFQSDVQGGAHQENKNEKLK